MSLIRAATAMLLLAALASSALAQTGTARVRVKVTDETDQPFPGVVVTLSNTRGLMTPVGLRTGADGLAIFGVIPAGQGYVITIATAGYMKIQDGPHAVRTGETLALLYSLRPERVEKVQVIATRTVASLDEPTGTVSISGEFFDDLPVRGRNYQSALTLAPGVNDADGDGNPNVHGARQRDFKATLDGVSNVDPLTGTFMSNVNPDAIEEIEVVTTGADASYGGAVGGFANIITKQGSNDFEGVFKMVWASWRLDGNGAGSLTPDNYKFRWYQPSVSVSGKIIRDKLFYALNHEYHDIGFPLTLVGAGGLVTVYDGWRHLDKITWQVSPRNKLNFQISADPYRFGPVGIDARTDPSSGLDQTQGGPTYSIEWQTPINPNFTVKSILGWSSTGLGLEPLTQGIKNACVVDPYATYPKDSPYRRKGPPMDEDYCYDMDLGRTTGSYYLDYADMRQRLTVKSDATLYVSSFLGREHTFDFGLLGERIHFSNEAFYYPFTLFAQNPANFQLGNTTTKSAILFRTTFAPGAPDMMRGEADGLTVGVYFQDAFRPHPTVSVRAGLRLERENVSAAGKQPLQPERDMRAFYKAYEVCNPTTPQLKGTCTRLAIRNLTAYEETWRVCPPKVHPGSDLCYFLEGGNPVPTRGDDVIGITNWNLGPRLNVSWDPNGDGRLKVFGTFSRAYDKIFLGVPVAEQGPFSFDLRYPASLETIFTKKGPQEVYSVLLNATRVGAPTVTQMSRQLRTPYANEFTFGVTKEIASETGLTLSYIKRRYKDQFQDVDINHYGLDRGDNSLPCAVLPDRTTIPQGKPDGLWDDCGGDPRYSYPQPDGVPDLYVRNPFFNQIFEVGNTNSSEYTAYQVELLRRLHHNWEMEGSYVWSKAVGNAEDYLQQLGDDPTTVDDEWGYLEYDQRHMVKINSRILLPVWGLTLGTIARWESGQPFSAVKTVSSDDLPAVFGAKTVAYNQTRTIYPSHQRNDHRNESFYTIDMALKRDFQLGKAAVTGEVEVLNLLNDDRLRISQIQNSYESAERRFGRRFQMSAKVNF